MPSVFVISAIIGELCCTHSDVLKIYVASYTLSAFLLAAVFHFIEVLFNFNLFS